MNRRVSFALAALAASCVLAFWFLSRGKHASAQPIAPDAPQAVERSAARSESIEDKPSNPAIHRAAVESADASAPTTSGSPSIRPGMALVEVLVLGKNSHAPVPGARVYSTCDSELFVGKSLEESGRPRGVPFEILITDTSGRAEIETPAHVKSDLVARGDDDKMGFATSEIPPLEEGATFEVRIEIGTEADMPFWVKVVDEATRSPLAGVKIAPRVEREPTPIVETDARGLAKVQARSWEQVAYGLRSKGRPELFVVSESGHDREDTALVVALPLAATLRVHAVLASGAAAAGADVHLTARDYDLRAGEQSNWWGSGQDPIYWKSLDDDGRASLTDLPPRVPLSVDLRGKCKWKAPEPIVLEPGEVRDVEWSITDGCEIRGTLVDQNGSPVTMHDIWLRKPDAPVNTLFQQYHRDPASNCVTDGSGRFSIARVNPGSWWIGPGVRPPTNDPGADDVAPLAQLIEIAPDQTMLDMTLRVDRGLYIRGHVLDSSARPAKAVHVVAYSRALELFDQTNSQGDGAFTIGPLMNGEYEVSAGGSNGDAESASVTARPGQDDVVLRLVKGASLSGRVVGDDGNGIAGIVRIANRDPTVPGPSRLTVQNDGTFEIEGLAPGTFDVSATTSNGWIGCVDPVVLAPGGVVKGLTVRVSPGGKVRVRTEGPETLAVVSILQRGVAVEGDYVALGKSQEWPCPPGNVVVRVRFYGTDGNTLTRTVERSVDVKAGETVDVVLEKDAH